MGTSAAIKKAVRDTTSDLVIDDRWPVGSVRLMAQLYGRCYDGKADLNWSLLHIKKDGELQERIERILRRNGFKEAYAPVPSMRGNLGITRWPDIIPTGTARIKRNYAEPADVLELRRGHAHIASPGNCPFFLATNGKRVYAAHAPQWGLLHPAAVCGAIDPHARRYPSVVDLVVSHLFTAAGKEIIKVKVYGGVRGGELYRAFSGEHAKVNQAIYRYLQSRHWSASTTPCFSAHDTLQLDGFGLDLPILIKQQFVSAGVPSESILLDHAYLPDTAWKTGGTELPRNLLLFGWPAR